MNKIIYIFLMLMVVGISFGRDSAILELQLLSEKIKEYERIDSGPIILGTILKPSNEIVSIVWKRVSINGDQRISLADAMLIAEKRTSELLPESHQAKKEDIVIALAMKDFWLLAYKIQGFPVATGISFEPILYVPVYYNGECGLELIPFTPPVEKNPSTGQP